MGLRSLNVLSVHSDRFKLLCGGAADTKATQQSGKNEKLLCAQKTDVVLDDCRQCQ